MSRFSRRSILQVSVAAVASSISRTARSEPAGAGPAIVRGEAKDLKTFDILGFDCANYPGHAALEAFRHEYQYRVVGFYLNHSKPDGSDPSWTAEVRAYLAKNAWGIFPIYFGSQADAPKKGLGTVHAGFAADRMTKCGFPKGSVTYLDIEPGKTEKAFRPYVEEWKNALWGHGYYGGVYASYKMIGWLTPVTSAIWTYELANKSSPAMMSVMGVVADECAGNIMDFSLLFENGILGYDPKKYPHGLIRQGCFATQYLHCQKPPGVPASPSPHGVYDLNSSLVADPSDLAEISERLNLKVVI